MRRSLTHRILIPALLIPGVLSATVFHLALKRAEPAQNATVATAPTAVRLWFTAEPEVVVTKVSVTANAGGAVTIGKIVRDTSAGRPIVAPITGRLAPGAYTVQWSTMAHDGHPVRGSYTFTLAH